MPVWDWYPYACNVKIVTKKVTYELINKQTKIHLYIDMIIWNPYKYNLILIHRPIYHRSLKQSGPPKPAPATCIIYYYTLLPEVTWRSLIRHWCMLSLSREECLQIRASSLWQPHVMVMAHISAQLRLNFFPDGWGSIIVEHVWPSLDSVDFTEVDSGLNTSPIIQV